MNYNIIGIMDKAIQDFDNKSINVVPSTEDEQGKRYLMAENNGYQFSQRKMLNDIDMAYNSIYKKGKYDTEGQRKLYLNIMRFYVNVAMKNTNVNTGDYQFIPSDYTTDNMWEAWFFKRQFGTFIVDEHYGETIDELNKDFNKYGSCVQRRVKDDITRVPLRSIRNDQGAPTLMEGIRGGIPLMVQHELSYFEVSEFKYWKCEDFKGKRVIQEMYHYMPKWALLELQGEKFDVTSEEQKKMILVMAIIMPSGKKEEDARKKYAGIVLFSEEVSEIPFEECHSEKQDGRWLGIGEAEKQLEAQIARNLSANLRRRSMLWASKQIFQTQGDEVTKNLVKNVKDGEVLAVGINGLIQKVDTSSRSLSDFSQDEEVWSQNSKEQAFAFESATGDSMPSGTPFRLGALLSNSAMSYFDGKKQTFGMFLERAFFSQIIPIFQKRAKDDLMIISSGEKGYENIRRLFIEFNVQNYKKELSLDPNVLDMNVPTDEEIQMQVEQEIVKSPYLATRVPAEVYKKAKYKVKLNIAGENTNIMDAESLTTTYQAMVQAGDPRASQLLDVILSSKGINLTSIVGQKELPKTPESVATPPAQGTASNPNLTGLVPQA